MRIVDTNLIPEKYILNIILEKQEYEYAVALASSYGISLSAGIFKCLSSPAFISALNT